MLLYLMHAASYIAQVLSESALIQSQSIAMNSGTYNQYLVAHPLVFLTSSSRLGMLSTVLLMLACGIPPELF